MEVYSFNVSFKHHFIISPRDDIIGAYKFKNLEKKRTKRLQDEDGFPQKQIFFF